MNLLLGFLVPPLVFVGLVWGWGLLATRALPNEESTSQAVLTPFFGLLALYLYGTIAHLFSPAAFNALVAVPALIGWWLGADRAKVLLKDVEVRSLGLAWLSVAAFGLLALAMIRNYSGGDWVGDWAGHYHRAQYFMPGEEDWSWILVKDPLAGRPPLQNLVTAVLLGAGADSFAGYQVYTLLLGSLVVWPAGWIVLRWPGASRAALPALTVGLMLSPLVFQNLTYPWTKMLTNAWVLLAVALATQSWREETHRLRHATFAAGAMASAVITHYSAAVYLVVLVPVFVVAMARRTNVRDCVRIIGACASIGALVLATWFGWILPRTGFAGLSASTTTGSQLAAAGDWTEPWTIFGENLVRTLVPHTLLPTPADASVAASPVAAWRDVFFQYYQTTLPLGLGLAGLAGVVRAWIRRPRPGVAGIIMALVGLGIWVHPSLSRWGLVHICLQPLVLAGLIVASIEASRSSGSSWRRGWVALLAVDALLGIGLQLWVESLNVLPHVLAMEGGRPLGALYGQAMVANSGTKIAFAYDFVGDLWPLPLWVPAVAAILFAGWGLRRALRAIDAELHGGTRP